MTAPVMIPPFPGTFVSSDTCQFCGPHVPIMATTQIMICASCWGILSGALPSQMIHAARYDDYRAIVARHPHP